MFARQSARLAEQIRSRVIDQVAEDTEVRKIIRQTHERIPDEFLVWRTGSEFSIPHLVAGHALAIRATPQRPVVAEAILDQLLLMYPTRLDNLPQKLISSSPIAYREPTRAKARLR